MSKTAKNKKSPLKTPSYTRSSISRYQKTSVKRVSLVFYTDQDLALINKLESIVNMSGYIKGLIQSDIDNHPSEPLSLDKSSTPPRYNKADKRRVSFLVNLTSEAHLLTRIEAQSNRSAYIKQLIGIDVTDI
ncbi:MAG: hypothetical protein VYA60_04775 [Pseudomonadota bacterium]|nr:hypothetical protein [Pseudomonadota bacterium]